MTIAALTSLNTLVSWYGDERHARFSKAARTTTLETKCTS